MLKEFVKVRQDKNGYKRLFTDDIFDLCVWYNKKGGDITGFQLIYDKYNNTRAITWIKDQGYRHNKIDGYDSNRMNMSPILVEDGIFKNKEITNLFLKHCDKIDKEIVDIVVKVIHKYDAKYDDQLI